MIRTATIADLGRATSVVAQFSADIGRRFDAAHFEKQFAVLMDAGLGVLFLLEQEGVIQGVFGGMAAPDLFHGGMVASEIFWFVRKEARGGIGGGRLLAAFETWALEQCCEEIQMVHLEASMPGELSSFYIRRGYNLVEARYSKQIQRFEPKEAA